MNRWRAQILRETLGRVDGNLVQSPRISWAIPGSREHDEMLKMAKELPDVFEIDQTSAKVYLRLRWLKAQGRTSIGWDIS